MYHHGNIGRQCLMTSDPFANLLETITLRSEDPKFEFRCTCPRTNWDHNNVFPWGVRRLIEMHCGGFNCSGMGAINLNSKGPTNFRLQTKGNRRRSIGYCPHLWKSPLQPFQPAQQSPWLWDNCNDWRWWALGKPNSNEENNSDPTSEVVRCGQCSMDLLRLPLSIV